MEAPKKTLQTVPYNCLWPSFYFPDNFKQMAREKGTKDDPWQLETPPGSSDYTMYKDVKDGNEILVCTVGKTILHYDYRCLNDLHQLK